MIARKQATGGTIDEAWDAALRDLFAGTSGDELAAMWIDAMEARDWQSADHIYDELARREREREARR